ncbi:conjugal transfer protein [Pseudomonas sp. PA15(2017)]|uniref:TIGR03751 family conjugal transfer lipoprotein n=1 Tax=Pseudomonas sp. PA15(2017) TaxID=1932111 RepID=UPI00095D02C5|nr:TIGR03751 family conjugal transfer lipoprotein [Pseudomonas sp. PA15(2017)]OLU25510.1 conjugal transfer protein [Pseudomonas sp. PA15(2017)]
MKAARLPYWILISLLALSGCSTTSEEMLPRGDKTMMDLWNSSGRGTKQQLADARASLRRPLTEQQLQQHPGEQTAYTRSAQNEIYNLFPRLPNPDLVMFVYPHLVGNEPAPIPGYSTVFPFYSRVQYAMPGERLEDY